MTDFTTFEGADRELPPWHERLSKRDALCLIAAYVVASGALCAALALGGAA